MIILKTIKILKKKGASLEIVELDRGTNKKDQGAKK